MGVIDELEAGCDRLHGYIAEKDKRIAELEAERDGWVAKLQAAAEKLAAAYVDLGNAEKRIAELEQELRCANHLAGIANAENERLRAAIRAFFAVHDDLGAFSLGDVEDNLRELVEDAG